MQRSVPEELTAAVKERRVILFAGAGLSMSVGLPSWQEFIAHLAGELGRMDRNWKVAEDKVRASKMHELIVALDFPIIYTTNYDRNIEAAFEVHGRDYVKIANTRDIARAREGVTQIVKFHGDFDDDDSLVITETDYFNRLAFNAPLDVKFHSDALGKTVLFVGYSMTDLNIRLLLHNL